jgi:hypothetical protein
LTRVANEPGGPSFRNAKGAGIVCGSKRERYGKMRSWPRSALKQAAISFVVATIAALVVLSYLQGEFFNAFYFPKTAHIVWTAGLIRQSSLLQFCFVGFEILIATSVLRFAIQRAVTARTPSKVN